MTVGGRRVLLAAELTHTSPGLVTTDSVCLKTEKKKIVKHSLLHKKNTFKKVTLKISKDEFMERFRKIQDFRVDRGGGTILDLLQGQKFGSAI